MQILQQMDFNYLLQMFVVIHLNPVSHLQSQLLAICLFSMKSELKPQDNNGHPTSSSPNCSLIFNNSPRVIALQKRLV